MKFCWTLLSFCLFFGACGPQDKNMKIDLQGHRGCRGLMPENSWAAFQHAIDLGVTTLEFDVVLSRDSQFVVSHEPWINGETCLWELGQHDEKALNIYEMTAEEVAAIVCGTQHYARFPDQKKIGTNKPLLREVVERTLAYCAETGRVVPGFNVEIKSRPEWDGVFHPEPATYVRHFLTTFRSLQYSSRFTVQSFDPRILMALHEQAPEVELVYLTEDSSDSPEKAVALLGFSPAVYSPNFKLVDAEIRESCTQRGMELVVWTVNKPVDIARMVSFQVDGIISDYPDRVLDYAATIGLRIQ
jgi:glycerophosphoryl diester phosphodiesterase